MSKLIISLAIIFISLAVGYRLEQLVTSGRLKLPMIFAQNRTEVCQGVFPAEEHCCMMSDQVMVKTKAEFGKIE